MAERSSRTHKRANVPEIYRKAAKILKSSEERKGSIKNLIYNSGFRDVKPLYALCAEACKHQNALDEFIRNTAGLNADPPTVDPHLAKVLITELVFGKGYLKPENARAIRIILELESQLKNSLLGMQSNSADESKHPPVPRYVRVNTLVCKSVDQVCDQFAQEGWIKVKLPKKSSYQDFIARVKCLDESEFLVDFHLDYLLVFPPNTQFHDHDLLKNGSILLQDKASCLSAAALANDVFLDGKIIDACAAPGMKTSLLAALSNNQSQIIAIERDVKRCKTLRQTIEKAKAWKVQVQCGDFLNLDPSNYSDVKYILVDPSCSGSGIINRFEPLDKKNDNLDFVKIRLEKLASLQCRLLEHAAKFQHVERIVYSTCSVHVEENESVVRQVLSKIGNNFQLEKALPWWERRGNDCYDVQNNLIGTNCVRANAKEDLTNGFFIAMFVRKH